MRNSESNRERKGTPSHRKSGQDSLRFISLGGLGEIGKNMYLIEYGEEILIIDSGLKFPDEEMLGIDFVIPDISYLVENKHRIVGAIITHGHEDHTGALAFVLPKLDIPIFATRLTLAMIAHKLEEAAPTYKVKATEIACVPPTSASAGRAMVNVAAPWPDPEVRVTVAPVIPVPSEKTLSVPNGSAVLGASAVTATSTVSA